MFEAISQSLVSACFDCYGTGFHNSPRAIPLTAAYKRRGLYKFVRGFGRAYKPGGTGLISGWAYKRTKKNVSK